MDLRQLEESIFKIRNDADFNQVALKVFDFQYHNNEIYRRFCQHLSVIPDGVKDPCQIPFMPIEFFKQHHVVCGNELPGLVFTSSGTTGADTSRHYVISPALYEKSFKEAFRLFWGSPSNYHILALLPAYLERSGSSLVYMAEHLIRLSDSDHSGFYLYNMELLREKIRELEADNRKVLLLGVSFALLDMAEKYPVSHPGLMVMETGGMKGRRKELVREELHTLLKKGLGVPSIFSEYGMTELLSQAYSKGEGLFHTPPWMKILIRDANDPLSYVETGKSGGISVIDLANLYSCSFIATRDLGKITANNVFQILGRFDDSDVRGCNLMVS